MNTNKDIVGEDPIATVKSSKPKSQMEQLKEDLSHKWRRPKAKNIKSHPNHETKQPRDYKRIEKLQAQINILKKEAQEKK